MTPLVKLYLIPVFSTYSNPVETAVPFTEFRKAGFEVDIATETGKAPECDAKMLTGMTQKLLVGL